MALTFDGDSGLFAKIGAFGKALKNAAATTDLTAKELAQIVNNIRAAAATFLIRTVNNDTPLRNLALGDALDEAVRQMITQSDTVLEPGGGDVAWSSLSSIGKIQSNLKDKYGNVYSTHRPSIVTLECVEPPGARPNYATGFRIYGEPLGDPATAQWFNGMPFAPVAFRMASGQTDGARGAGPNTNMLVNSGFERFGSVSSHVPDNWTLDVGSSGTHIQSHTDAYLGAKAIKFIGDAGGTKTAISQKLGDSSGSGAFFQPYSHYAIRYAARRYDSGAITGELQISVKDGDGNILSSGTATTGAIDASTLSDSYVNGTIDFYIGADVPAAASFVIELVTELGDGHELFIDEVVLTRMIPLAGFGHFALFDGPTPCPAGVASIYTRSNDGTALQASIWERLFGISAYGITLPSAASGDETLDDQISVDVP